jgi:hypothetical protein
MNTPLEILQKWYYKYYENSFVTEEQGREYAEIVLSIKEEREAIISAMEELAKDAYNQAIRDAAENAEATFETLDNHHSYPYVDSKSILKLLKK